MTHQGQAREGLAGDCLSRSRRPSRFSDSRRLTVPSSSQRQAIAVTMAGVFHVVTRIARSIAGTSGAGAATKPNRRPVATLLDSPDT